MRMEYGIQEHTSDRYPPRTALNVREADATLCFATDWASPGEVLTRRLCKRYGKPRLDVTPGGAVTPVEVAAWVVRYEVRMLNVAGTTDRTSPGIEVFAPDFLADVFTLLREEVR